MLTWHREVPLLLMTLVGAWKAAAADTEAMKKLRASIERCDVEETQGVSCRLIHCGCAPGDTCFK